MGAEVTQTYTPDAVGLEAARDNRTPLTVVSASTQCRKIRLPAPLSLASWRCVHGFRPK